MKEIDRVFRSLADPSRRELLDRLHAKNGQTLSELCKGLESIPNKRLVLTWGDVADAADAAKHSRVPLIPRLLARWCA
jgi:hypothetical protein